jgi:plastocyanin
VFIKVAYRWFHKLFKLLIALLAMKTGVLIGVIVVLLIFGFYVFNGKNKSDNAITTVSANTVKISNFAFSPSEIIVKVGENVTWINEDSAPHAIVSDFGDEMVSKQLAKGESYTHTFILGAVYEYHCSVHPSMKGKVIVQ